MATASSESVRKTRKKRPPHRLLDALRGHPVGQMLLAALSGTLLFLACADFDIWPLAWLGLVPLLWVLLDDEGNPVSQRPFLHGYITGLFANGGGFYWIVGLLMRFGHLPFIAALPLFLLLIAYQALTFGLFATILCRLRRHVDLPVLWLAPLIFVACELCVPYVFPWYFAITQAWVPSVIQIADITGPLGVSFLLMLSNGALWQMSTLLFSGRSTPRRESGPLLSPAWRPIAGAVLCIIVSLGYGAVRIYQVDRARAQADKIKVGVVQANVGIHEKFVEGLSEAQHGLHLRLSQALAQKGAELIVWPESSYPYPLPRTFRRDFSDEDARKLQRGFHTPLLFGALTVERRGRRWAPYNTAIFLDASSNVVGTFDKNFLLIFGEYLPFASELSFLKEWIPAISTFERGTETTTFPLEHHGHAYAIGPMICYEDIIPAFGRRLFSSATPPNLLINITNDAWFGATSEPYEHLALAVFRAVEHRVDLVRAVNTGVSAFIDATGRVYQKGPSVDPSLTPDAQPVTLLAEAALLQSGGLYQRLGDSFGGGCFIAVLLIGLLARRRAGLPLHWDAIAIAVLAMQAAILLTALISQLFADASENGRRLGAFYAVLSHRGEAGIAESILFQATWQLLLILMLATGALGVWLGRRLGGLHEHGVVSGRLELVTAVALTTVAPVVLFGRMEGNTGGVVITSCLAIGLGLLGLRIGTRLAKAQSKAP